MQQQVSLQIHKEWVPIARVTTKKECQQAKEEHRI